VTRVLFLTESFHPTLGGGEGHVRDLSRRLAASGVPATVVTRRGERAWRAEETLDGVRVVRVPPSGPGRTGKYAMVPAAIRALRREAAAYDVLVVRGTRVLGLPGLLAARSARKAVVLQPEVNGELTGEVYTWGTALDRPLPRRAIGAAVAARNRILRDADAFVAMSRLIRDEMLGAGVAPEKVRHIPHGVDTERFRPATPDERRDLHRRVVRQADPPAQVAARASRPWWRPSHPRRRARTCWSSAPGMVRPFPSRTPSGSVSRAPTSPVALS